MHEQVQMQLDYLKRLVDEEKENERRCKEWKIPYIPSNRKWENIQNYENYKEEIEKNGDKICLLWFVWTEIKTVSECMVLIHLQDDMPVNVI